MGNVAVNMTNVPLPEEISAFSFGELVVLGGYALEQLSSLQVLGQDDALLLALEVVGKVNDVAMVLQSGNGENYIMSYAT